MAKKTKGKAKGSKQEHNRNYLFTSESVTIGHPDKVADQISDSILDALLSKDPNARVACETLVATGLILIAGEITTTATVDYAAIAREKVKEIGYTDPSIGFDGDNCAVLVAVGKQSEDISRGVTEGTGLHREQGAGDQGLMFGYACRETPSLMPMPINLAHKITDRMVKMRRNKKMDFLRPDGKSQVTVEYDEKHTPKRIHTVVVSTQHTPDVRYATLKKEIIENVIMPSLPKKLVDNKMIVHVNPTGRFVVGGPKGDCGLTGRKIIVDTYGGKGSHGGGAFSGKDPSKVDRTASYMARYIAKNIVAAKLADRCEVQLAYAIGIANPLSVLVDCMGTAKVDERKIEQAVKDIFPLTPKGMIDHLRLCRPIFAQTAQNGHFGQNHSNFTWEKTDMVTKLQKALGVSK